MLLNSDYISGDVIFHSQFLTVTKTVNEAFLRQFLINCLDHYELSITTEEFDYIVANSAGSMELAKQILSRLTVSPIENNNFSAGSVITFSELENLLQFVTYNSKGIILITIGTLLSSFIFYK